MATSPKLAQLGDEREREEWQVGCLLIADAEREREEAIRAMVSATRRLVELRAERRRLVERRRQLARGHA